MTAADDILRVLDRCCDDFTFPMLDNGYVYLSATRLSLHRSLEDWAMVIEVFGFSPRADLPDTFIYTFASKLRDRNRRSNTFLVRPTRTTSHTTPTMSREPSFRSRAATGKTLTPTNSSRSAPGMSGYVRDRSQFRVLQSSSVRSSYSQNHPVYRRSSCADI